MVARLHSALKGVVLRARRVPAVRRIIDNLSFHNMRLSSSAYADRRWEDLDRLYSLSRRALLAMPAWRLGSARVHEVAYEGFTALSRHAQLAGKRYCDLGCGPNHPFGTSVVMFLNGAASTVALDIDAADETRAAEALADLIVDCLCEPDRWNWTGLPGHEFIARAQCFDLAALRGGKLAEGLRQVDCRHLVGDIQTVPVQDGSVDLMSSRAVLEHFLDFDGAMARLFRMMSVGGVAYHAIDLVDHRAYVDPRFHYWSFLSEDQDWSDGLVNRLRAGEIRPRLERAGFEILEYELASSPMPDGFRNQLAARFRDMLDEELSVTTVMCVLRKP